jgi:VanZ family protein
LSKFLQHHQFTSYQLPAILWAILIFVASSIPNATLPDLRFIPADKAVHLFVYLVLCALIYRALHFQKRFLLMKRSALLIAFLLSVMYGMSDEFHQMFVPNRVADVDDLAADTLGALLFVLVLLILRKLRPLRDR